MIMPELPDPGAGIGLGLKFTFVPEGTPEVVSVMELLKPPLTVVVMVEVFWLPCGMVREEGDAEMVKFLPALMTVRVTVVFCCIPPPLPVTVMGYVPVGVLLPTVMVIVELPEPGAGIVCGLKLTVVPTGTPEADRLIAPLKPPLMAVLMVDVPCFPWATLSAAGDAEI